MQTRTIEVDAHSAELIHYALLESLSRARTELGVIRLARERELDRAERLLLPCALRRAKVEGIAEQLDAWISLVQQTEYWAEEFNSREWPRE